MGIDRRADQRPGGKETLASRHNSVVEDIQQCATQDEVIQTQVRMEIALLLTVLRLAKYV